jgi:hypothetical protein
MVRIGIDMFVAHFSTVDNWYKMMSGEARLFGLYKYVYAAADLTEAVILGGTLL